MTSPTPSTPRPASGFSSTVAGPLLRPPTNEPERARRPSIGSLVLGIAGGTVGLLPLLLLPHGLTAVRRHHGMPAEAAATWIGVGLVIVWSVAFIAGCAYVGTRGLRRRLARATSTTGTVVEVEPEGVDGTADRVEYPTVRFRLADGTELDRRTTVADAGHTAGDSVELRYDPENPDWVIIRGGETDRWVRRARLVALGLLGIGLALIAYGAYRWLTLDPRAPAEAIPSAAARRAAKAHRSDLTLLIGGPAIAAFGLLGLAQARRAIGRLEARRARALEVTGTVVKLDRSGSTAQPTFAFRTFEGIDTQARSAVRYDGKREREAVAEGSIVRVLYDPQDPTWAVAADAPVGSLKRSSYVAPAFLALMGVFCFAVAFLPD